MQSMSQTGTTSHKYNGDSCLSKTSAEKARCKSGEGLSRNREAGALFQDQMCPCFDKVSGSLIEPSWLTTELGCKDLRVADSGESLRQANKASDFSLGFDVVRLELDDELDPFYNDTERTGCKSSEMCCGAMSNGQEILRCVNKANLASKGWTSSVTCKKFNPPQVLNPNRKWFQFWKSKTWYNHWVDTWRCAEQEGPGSTFDGHWSLHGKTWSKNNDSP